MIEGRKLPRTKQEVLFELRRLLRLRAERRGLLAGSRAYDSYVYGTYNREKDRVLRKWEKDARGLDVEIDEAKAKAGIGG